MGAGIDPLLPCLTLGLIVRVYLGLTQGSDKSHKQLANSLVRCETASPVVVFSCVSLVPPRLEVLANSSESSSMILARLENRVLWYQRRNGALLGLAFSRRNLLNSAVAVSVLFSTRP